MWCFACIAGLAGAWLMMGAINGAPYLVGPDGQRAVLVLAVLGAVLRIVAQPSLAEQREDDRAGL